MIIDQNQWNNVLFSTHIQKNILIVFLLPIDYLL